MQTLSRSTIVLFWLFTATMFAGAFMRVVGQAPWYGALAEVVASPTALFWVVSLQVSVFLALAASELLALPAPAHWILRLVYLPLLAWTIAVGSPRGASSSEFGEELDRSLSAAQRDAVLHVERVHTADILAAIVLVLTGIVVLAWR